MSVYWDMWTVCAHSKLNDSEWLRRKNFWKRFKEAVKGRNERHTVMLRIGFCLECRERFEFCISQPEARYIRYKSWEFLARYFELKAKHRATGAVSPETIMEWHQESRMGNELDWRVTGSEADWEKKVLETCIAHLEATHVELDLSGVKYGTEIQHASEVIDQAMRETWSEVAVVPYM